ncbi:NAD(P)-binding protein [Mangrovitalea sediminis]|uniref:NAD(P)-binding protein n=1 Tax=Mangrovitalea sediminis TaxID=1982043 RepID=UPI000BE54F76|nr:NAD(P)/FAD-dependent oxidoreductase [Mangrovitalea sediminis]
MTDYDLIIVGGGPAGSSLAWALRDSGKRLLIIDKQTFPRDKTCAGWVTPAVLDSLQVDRHDYAASNIMQPIHGFRIGMMGQDAVENDHGDKPVSYGIRRCEFDDYLLSRVDVDKALGTGVKTIERQEGQWLINGEYRAPLLVGAGGHFCPVARHLGEGPGKHETAVAAKEIEFEMNDEQAARCGVREDIPELWFCDDLKGYAWVFRKGRYLNIGLGREDNHRLTDHLNAFVDEMKAKGRIPDDMPSRFKGHAYLLYEHADRPLIGDGIMLIGDAAGLAYTQSGEGIRPAIESALIAADIIQTLPDYSTSSLQSYATAIAQRFGLRSADRKSGWDLPEWAKTRIAARLMRSHWFTRHVVTNRWFLHTEVPALKAG